MRTCEHCGGPMLNPLAKRFCSRKCSAAVGAALTRKPKVTVACRFCGKTTEVFPSVAALVATCGAAACKTAQHRVAGSRPKGQGEANPRYKDGRWTRTEKQCEVCGVPFTGRAKRRFCSLVCSAKQKAATQQGVRFDEERKARMRGRSGTGPKSEAWKDAASLRLRGVKNPMWLGGRRADMDRSTRRYEQWQSAVLTRDQYACQHCGRTENVVAHHIKEWRPYPALRYVTENGIALCKSCHSRLHRGSLVLTTQELAVGD